MEQLHEVLWQHLSIVATTVANKYIAEEDRDCAIVSWLTDAVCFFGINFTEKQLYTSEYFHMDNHKDDDNTPEVVIIGHITIQDFVQSLLL
jgi:hypothetical protein